MDDSVTTIRIEIALGYFYFLLESCLITVLEKNSLSPSKLKNIFIPREPGAFAVCDVAQNFLVIASTTFQAIAI